MKTLLLIFFQLFVGCIYAQDKITFSYPLKAMATQRINSDIKSGTAFYINGIKANYNNNLVSVSLCIKKDDSTEAEIDLKKMDGFNFIEIDNISKLWDKQLIINGTYANLFIKGYQNELRNELNNEAWEYINTLAKYDNFFVDQYLEDYLYILINKIHSVFLNDGRPGNLFIKILKDPLPYSFAMANGGIIISSGLLSNLQSEDELVGILAYDIAHFVLDHQILNTNAALDRNQRAEFWSNFATTMATGTDIALSLKYRNHISGLIPATASVVSSAISEDVNSKLGTNFTLMQQNNADRVALEIIQLLNYDRSGLPVALQRIQNYCYQTGSFQTLADNGLQSNLSDRINTMGLGKNPDSLVQPDYMKKVSYITTYNAAVELWSYAHYQQADYLASRNIKLGVGTESDYIVSAVIMRRLSNTRESNEEVINLLNKAKTLNISPTIIVSREEGISYMRLDKKSEAKLAFQTYLNALLEQKNRNNGYDTRSFDKVLEDEINWTKVMILKVDGN